MRCFEDSDAFSLQDAAPFKFRHKLQGHPALELDTLKRLVPTLPEDQLYYSNARMKRDDDFESSITDRRSESRIDAIIENIRSSSGYIMVRSPEVLPAFRDLYRDLVADVGDTVRARGFGPEATEPMLYLFISSPNAVTPFHFDRQSNFLFQLRGSKVVTIFKPWDPRVITQLEYEHHISRKELAAVKWKPEAESLGTAFDFQPGEALHIPYCGGHHVTNGPGDLSISLAIFFNHQRNEERMRALLFNRRVRPYLAKVGTEPGPVARHRRADAFKARAFSALSRAANRLRPRR